MSDILILFRALISNAWNLCLTVMVPGLGISFAALFVSIFIFSIGIRLFKFVSDSGISIGGGRSKNGDDA